MTYIDYLNRFNQWLESNALPANSQLMYFKLLNVFNRAGWPETVQVDNLRMRLMLDGLSLPAVVRARDKLVDAGFVRYKRGKKGAPNHYILCNGPEIQLTTFTKNVTENVTKSVTESVTKNVTHIKTLDKDRKTSPPKAPQGAGDGFAKFWQAYPRRVGKANALKAWEKLSPDDELTEKIVGAVERQKRTDQWQRDEGRYIPHPATWLNQRRWEDELDPVDEPFVPTPMHVPTPEEDHPVTFTEDMDWRDLV